LFFGVLLCLEFVQKTSSIFKSFHWICPLIYLGLFNWF
jgi:hypothetical protein